MMTGMFHRARVYVALLVVAAYLPAARSVYAHPVSVVADSTSVAAASDPVASVADSTSVAADSVTAASVAAEMVDSVSRFSAESINTFSAENINTFSVDNIHTIDTTDTPDTITTLGNIEVSDSVVIVEPTVDLAHIIVKERIDSVAIRDSLFERARNRRLVYDFTTADSLLIEAASYYPSPSDSVAFRKDSLEYASVENEKLLCENGFNMSRYVTFPEVVAKRMFSIDDFFLWYPLADRSWVHTPDTLDRGDDASFKLCYVPQDSDKLLFSSTEPSGYRSIYSMDAMADSVSVELAGSLWSNKQSVFGRLTSSSDEIFPMMSPDGNTIWFASSGLYGVGGYDLYESQWDEENKSWSVPVNMGFPFSSPANDYLLTVTQDEKYMIFASDRGCPKDSVNVYVIIYDPVPVKSAVESPEELRSVAELSPNVSAVAVETVAVADEPMESKDNQEYTEKMNLVRSLRDSISNHGAEMEALREEFVLSDDDDRRQELTVKILSMEKALPALQSAYAEASAALQKIEMEFLFNGVFIDANKAAEAADRKVVSASSSFVFTKKSMGSGGN